MSSNVEQRTSAEQRRAIAVNGQHGQPGGLPVSPVSQRCLHLSPIRAEYPVPRGGLL